MGSEHDVAVIGLGAMGSAIAYHLARRGQSVIGLEQFTSPHDKGSSAGETRIIREAYHESPLYVPLVRRAYELWAELEREAPKPLLTTTGGLLLGAPDSTVYAGAQASVREFSIPHEALEHRDLRKRFPQLRIPPGTLGLLERRAGALRAEACIRAHLDGARRHGATLQMQTTVDSWSSVRGRIRLKTSRGDIVADKLVIASGAWTKGLAGDVELPLRVERQVSYWFRPTTPRAFKPESLPIFIWEFEPGRVFYGFPDFGGGVKVALHHEGDDAQPETLERTVDPEEIQQMRDLVRRLAPDLDSPPVAKQVCMYTNTPDFTFLVDKHPDHDNVVIASPCSGHGFKFAPAIGEAVAQLLLDGAARMDLRWFQISRWLDT